ncbi:MAG: hypothetical protein ACI3YI_07080 [Bacteroidaceae bacterium]
MSRKANLEECLADYERHTLMQVHLLWTDGTKAGISNKKAMDAMMRALKEELKRQIAEEDGTQH